MPVTRRQLLRAAGLIPVGSAWRRSPRASATPNLLLNGLSYLPVGMAPGVSIGDAAGAATSFGVSYWYAPTVIEWLIVGGILAGGALLFTLAAMLLPLHEPGHG